MYRNCRKIHRTIVVPFFIVSPCILLIINYTHQHMHIYKGKGKSKAVQLQAWSGPQGSRKLRFPDFMTTAQDGGKVVSLTHRPPLPPGNASDIISVRG